MLLHKYFMVLFVMAGMSSRVAADSADTLASDSSRIVPWRFGAVCTVVGGAVIASQIQQSSLYWSDKSSFYTNSYDDWQYANGADKFGHALASNLLSVGLSEALEWSGVDTTTSVWTGFAFAMLHQTLVELRDGYSKGKDGVFAPYLGFSWADMGANTIGASLTLAQHYLPTAKNIRLKYSLKASDVYRKGGYYSSIMNDYESEYHWLSVPVYDYLGHAARKYWTPYLNFAIGHSVKGIVDAPSHYTYSGQHCWYLSLDFNLEALPGDASWWRTLKRMLNFYKLPAPCVQVYPNVVWYGLRL